MKSRQSQGPDRMSVHQIGDYLTAREIKYYSTKSKGTFSRLVNLIPKPTNIVPPVTSSLVHVQQTLNCKKRSQLWLTSFSGDVDYQVQSLNTLTEALVDKEATKKAVCKKMWDICPKKVTLKKLSKCLREFNCSNFMNIGFIMATKAIVFLTSLLLRVWNKNTQ
ncbi:unnamed protein product [Mytilus edulis]|uniref:Uncharacterized protein n=1 Tax=Mytilus edulis TaxID=6550 RepID=A0A8S3SG04_MYTED|nr:unnamed protein product [Mytilus edulis]